MVGEVKLRFTARNLKGYEVQTLEGAHQMFKLWLEEMMLASHEVFDEDGDLVGEIDFPGQSGDVIGEITVTLT